MDKIEYWTSEWEDEFTIVNGKLDLDNLTVKRDLDLYNCTSLLSLPDNLTVGGNFYLKGCTSLKYLPDNLTVGGNFYLIGCTSLLSLPDNLTVGGYIDIRGCTSLKHIGKNNLFEKVFFDQYFISQEPRYSYIRIFQDIPESLKQSFIGKRVIDIIDDPRIYGTRYAEAIITKLDEHGNFVIDTKGERSWIMSSIGKISKVKNLRSLMENLN